MRAQTSDAATAAGRAGPAPSGRTAPLVLLASAVVVIVGLRHAEPLLVPLVFAALVVAISSPISAWAAHRGLPAVVGALLALVVDLALIAGVGLLVTLAVTEVQEKLPLYMARAAGVAEGVASALQARHIPVTTETIRRALGGDSVVPAFGVALSQLANAASGVVVVLLVVFFTLWEMSGFSGKLVRLLPQATGGFGHVDRIVREVQRYLLVKTVVSALMAVLVFAWLEILGVGPCLLLATLMFLLHFVPNVGAVVATIPAVGIALLDRGAATALAVLLGYVVLMIVVGSVVESRALGRTLRISPLVVLLSLLFWGWLWGPAGSLLSVPLTMIGKIILENHPRLAWIARCVEPDGGAEPIARRIRRSLSLHPRMTIGIGSAHPAGHAAHASVHLVVRPARRFADARPRHRADAKKSC